MAKTETVKYNCDKCHCDMSRPKKSISFSRDISDLWKPDTWGRIKKTEYDLCDKCSTDFFNWLHSHDRY